MKRGFAWLAVLALMLVVAVPALAQDIDVSGVELTGSYSWSGVALEFPDGWEAYEDDDGFTHLGAEETDILFIFYAIEEEGESVQSFIELVFDRTRFDDTLEWDPDSLLSGMLPNYELFAYSYTENNGNATYQRAILGQDLGDGIIMITSVIPTSADEISASAFEEIFAILNSVRMVEEDDSNDSSSSSSGGLGGLLGGNGDEPATQDEGQYTWSFDLDDLSIDVQVEFTDIWEITFDDDEAEHLTSENTDIVFSFYRVEDSDDTLEAFVQQNFENTRIDESIDFDAGSLVAGSLPNFDEVAAYQYIENYEGDEYARIIIAIQPHPDVIIVAAAIPLSGRDIADEDLTEILNVIDTFTVTEVSGSSTQTDSSGKR